MDVGETFPDLVLQDPGGTAVPLGSLWAEGPVLVVVGHTGCDTTRFSLPHVERLHARRGAAGRVVVVLQDEPQAARDITARLELTVPILLDPEPYALATALDLQAVPTSYLIDRGGRIGAISVAFRRTDVESFADAVGVPPPLYAVGEKVPALRPG